MSINSFVMVMLFIDICFGKSCFIIFDRRHENDIRMNDKQLDDRENSFISGFLLSQGNHSISQSLIHVQRVPKMELQWLMKA